MDKTTKTKQIINHLKQYGSITNQEAFDMYGATRLSAIIFELRKRGYDIETLNMPYTDRNGNPSNCGKYVLKK